MIELRNMASTCSVRSLDRYARRRRSLLITHISVGRRSGESLHQEDHVTIEQVDGWWKDLEARGRHHRQGDRRACRTMAIRRMLGMVHQLCPIR